MSELSGRTVEVIAHRGASADAPEHTFQAYDLAIAQGADTLELDVRATADCELVVVHDRTLWRTAHEPRRVAAISARELSRLDPCVRPLTLEDVLARYGGRTGLLVELKDPEPTWEARVAAALARHGVTDRAVVQSFDRAALRRLRVAAPHLALAPLARRPPATGARLRRLGTWADGIGVRHGAIDAAHVLRAHDAGLVVRAWTVNTPAQIERLVRLGVDGIITDVPAVARAVVDRTPAVQRARTA